MELLRLCLLFYNRLMASRKTSKSLQHELFLETTCFMPPFHIKLSTGPHDPSVFFVIQFTGQSPLLFMVKHPKMFCFFFFFPSYFPNLNFQTVCFHQKFSQPTNFQKWFVSISFFSQSTTNQLPCHFFGRPTTKGIWTKSRS